MKYHVIGLMSGTSLDGLDIAFCEFSDEGNHWTYKIHCAETVPYADHWKDKLSILESGSAFDFVKTDTGFGHLLGSLTRDFINRNNVVPDFIASHGHTIFHQPEKGITSQIGSGSAIAAETGLNVICDFRSLDVALGGQGAPLVPIGDELLFTEYDFCLNIGGFANISSQKDGNRIAYDICPANIVMNHLASMAGSLYDHDGLMAASGTANINLLNSLNALPFYTQPPPKSLGKEWVTEHIQPLLSVSDLTIPDLLSTYCEHIAIQVSHASGNDKNTKMLVTGGGTFNKFLMQRIRHHSVPEIIIPDANTINFKEALIFAFLGVLRRRNEPNCLQSVTGATKDSSGGAIYF
ncbi:MAG: anhydro-N-acetylmuramic acid kinase [Bacteroidales bacterium]|nr:anhydro-N-acetylmuramic acid kinase [Bacteroidales bacterium]